MNSPAFRLWVGAILIFGAARLFGLEPAAGESPVTGSAPPAELKLAAQFGPAGGGRLNAAERQAARAYLAQHPLPGPPPGRPGQQAEQSAALEPVRRGASIAAPAAGAPDGRPLYDPRTLRTLFLNFEEQDWEGQLSDFARTDIQVPAQLLFDGRSFAGVGVRFHSPSGPVPDPAGYKRSLDLQLDHTVAGQALENQHVLRLVAARTDATFLRTMLYARVAQEYVPTPQANFVRVVINGEDWGVYVSTQPFDENFIQDNFHTTAGARWTVRPGGNLSYLGDNPDAYRKYYRLESPEDPAAWAALIHLCQALNQTARSDILDALAPLLDLTSTLRFLALENALMNQDGYGGSAGTYALYLDQRGRFHLIPQDAEVSFRLQPQSEYVEQRVERRPAGNEKAKKPDADIKAPKGYDPKDFPHQTATDLAMLLSYSFMNKADTDLDTKVTRDEWSAFARAWFMVMDEDFTGRLTGEQFLVKFRSLVTPPSIADRRTKQTFGQDDPAGIIGRDFLAVLDEDHDGQLVPAELARACDRWFTEWSDPKTGKLTQPRLQKGFEALFSRSIFQADQRYIAQHGPVSVNGDARPQRPTRRSGGWNPLRLFGLGGRPDGPGGFIVFHEELDPLAGVEDETRPLLTNLLSDPILRGRYLTQLGDITANWLTWKKLGPIAKEYHALIAADVEKDTHKPASYQKFVQELDQDTTNGARNGDEAPSLRNFITERSSYLDKSGLLPTTDR